MALMSWMRILMHSSHVSLATAAIISCLFCYVVYMCVLIVYRLFFSPLAKFPGPKLAAATGWYETYFELFKGIGGQYTFHIQKLHERYGPVLRINPDEIHIDDPEFFEKLYTQSPGYDKPSSIQYRFGSPYAAFSTPEHDIHRVRRTAISPFFSKKRITQQTPSIQDKVDRLCSRLAREFAGTNKVVVLNNLFNCYVADVVTKYAFNKCYDFLDKPDFQSPFTAAVRGFKDIVHPCAQFPWLPRLVKELPDSLIMLVQPSMASVIQFQQEMKTLIRGAQYGRELKMAGRSLETIFDGILQSDLPSSELSVERLKDEAVSIIGAGIASAEWTSTLACFHIISDPKILRRLKFELTAAIPDPQGSVSLMELEKLPYLMACVEESVRLACGQMARSPRISRGTPIRYGSWIIPVGMTVSMDTWHMHHNERIYPKSFEFVPERWLGDPKGPDGKKKLSRYMTAFGKGTRVCVGMNLAHAEITMVIAALFRRFEFDLFKTDYEDVRIVRDVIAPDPRPDSKGVRVVIRSSCFAEYSGH